MSDQIEDNRYAFNHNDVVQAINDCAIAFSLAFNNAQKMPEGTLQRRNAMHDAIIRRDNTTYAIVKRFFK